MTTNRENSTSVVSLVEEFVDRHRSGECPTIEEYCDRYPDLADEIRDVFEAVLMVEDLKPGSKDESLSIRDNAVRLDLDVVGDYRILSVIGRGGMGIVYEAEQQSLGRRVALKVLPTGTDGDARALERFQREARAAARMHHTNIVPVFDVGEDGEWVYYAMQLIRGQSLDLVIEEIRRLDTSSNGKTLRSEDSHAPSVARSVFRGQFQNAELTDSESDASGSRDADPSPKTEDDRETSVGSSTLSDSATWSGGGQRHQYYRTIAHLGIQAADALSYAHERGTIHRDIKPANLLVDTEGVLWIADFGLAKTDDSNLTRTGDVLGTIRYMSPERFRGHCDPRSDIYALGLTLYEAMTLQPAFANSNRGNLIEQITRGAPTPPRSVDGRIPRDLETITLKAIDKDPRRRYQSAAEMRDDLQRFVDDKPIHARRITPVERLIRWGRHNKSLSMAMVIVASLLVFIAGSSMQSASRERRRREELSHQNVVSMQTASRERRRREDLSHQTFVRNIRDIGRRVVESGVSCETLPQLQQAAEQKDAQNFAVRYLLQSSQQGIHTVQLSGAATRLAERDGKIILFVPELNRKRGPGAWHRVTRFQIFEWDPAAKDSSMRLIYEDDKPRYDVNMSYDGQRIAINDEYKIRMIDLQNGVEQWMVDVESFGVQYMRFSRDGRWLATRARNELRVFDADLGTETSKTFVAEWNEDGINNLRVFEVAPDGVSALLVDYPMNGGTVVRDLTKSGNPFSPHDRMLRHWRFRSTVHVAAFSANNKVCGWVDHLGTINVWDRVEDELFVVDDVAPQVPSCMTFSKNGRAIATGDFKGNITVCDVSTRSVKRRTKIHDARVNSLCFAADDSILVSCDESGHVSRFALDNTVAQAKVYRQFGASLLGAAFSPESSLAIVDAKSARSLRKTDDQWVPYDAIERPTSQVAFRAAVFAPKSSELAVGENNGINLYQQQPTKLLRHLDISNSDHPTVRRGSFVTSIAYSPDEVWIAAGYGLKTKTPGVNADQIVTIWDRSSGEVAKVLAEFNNDTRGVAFSPDGTLLRVASADGTIRSFKVSTWDEHSVIRVPDVRFWSLAYSPTGEHFAVGDGDGLVTVFDASTEREYCRLIGHTRAITSLAFTSTGESLASGSWDGSVRLWDLRAKSEQMLMGTGLAFVRDVTFDRHDEFLAVVSQRAEQSTVSVYEAVSIDRTRRALEGFTAKKADIIKGPSDDSGDESSVAEETSIERDHVGVLPRQSPDADEIRPPLAPLWLPAKYNPIHINRGRHLLGIGRGARRTRQAKSVFAWDLATGEIVERWNTDKTLTQIAINEAEVSLAAGDSQGGVTMLDFKSQKQLWAVPAESARDNPVRTMAFSKANQVATITEDGQLRVMDAQDGTIKFTHSFDESGLQRVCFSTDGRWLVAGSPCVLFDASSGEIAAKFPTTSVSATFAPHNDLIATANQDGRVTLWNWDGKTLSLTKTLESDDELGRSLHIRFNSDGTRMLVVYRAAYSHLLIWDTSDWKAIASGRSKIIYDAQFHPTKVQLTLDCGFGFRFLDFTKREPVTVDRELLDSYAGRYQKSLPGPNHYYQVKRSGNHLKIRSGISPRWRDWFPLSETTFYTEEEGVTPDTYSFIRSKDNRATHMVLHYDMGFLATQPRLRDDVNE